MKLLLLFTVTTCIVVRIDAAILSDTQHITNDLDRQITDLYKARDVKENLKSRTKESLAAAGAYFKTPDAGELRSNALNLAQERLAAAAEYLKAPEYPKHLSRTQMENARAAVAEYFKASVPPRHNTRIDRTVESLAAAAEYFQAPENYSKMIKVAKKSLAAVRKPLSRSTKKTPRHRFVRLG
nr:uncharacterized protein LOC118683143 [Bactrocera oleae]